MEQQFTRKCAPGWSAAFFNPSSRSSVRGFSAVVITHRPFTATFTELRTLHIGLVCTGWRWSRWSDQKIIDLLQAAREITPKGTLRTATYGALFGLIAATGLRISEAVHLVCWRSEG